MTARPTAVAGDMPEERTYGGWREARGMGIGRLSSRQSLALVLIVGAELVSMAISLPAAAWGLLVVAPAIVVTVAQWDGVALLDALAARLRWWHAVWGQRHEFRGGLVASAHSRAWQLPGVLATTQLLAAEDYTGRSYGVVWDRRSGRLSGTLRVAAASPWLADGTAADQWVASWGAWLTQLGYRPLVRWVAVTTASAPEAGARLSDTVRANADPAAPGLAARVMTELVAMSPAAAAAVETTVTITIDPAASPATRSGGLAEELAELDRELDAAATALAGCGGQVLGRASPQQVAATVRRAYDPAARGEIDRALAGPASHEVLSWDNAGPVAATEAWDSYRHDSGTSISWGLHEPPRQNVTSSVLAPLIAPVNGHQVLPGGGQEISPLVDVRSPHGWTGVLPGWG